MPTLAAAGRITSPASRSATLCAGVREDVGLTQAELADWLGINVRHVEAVAAGRRQLSYAVHCRLRHLSNMWLTTRLVPTAPVVEPTDPGAHSRVSAHRRSPAAAPAP